MATDSDTESSKALLRNSGKKNAPSTGFSFGFQPSWFRVATYNFLLLTLALGYALTYKYNVSLEQGGGRSSDSEAPLLDLRNNALFNTFGFNNVCIYIDDLPGKYVTVWTFELLIICFSAYEFCTHVSVRLAQENGVYSKLEFYIMRAMAVIVVLLITYAIEIFAVHPKDNMFMHTLPFSSLIMAIILMGIRNVYHDFHMVDFEATYSFMKYVELGFGVLMVVFSVGKLYVQYSAIVLHDPVSAGPAGIIDKTWLVVAVAVPWLKAWVTICSQKVLPRTDRLMHINVTASSYDDASKDDSSSRKPLDKPYFQFGLHQSWFRVATYNFLAAALAVGLTLTKKYNIPVEQGGGRTKDSEWPLLDLKNNALFGYFGYNNVCIYVDEIPGKYVTTWIFELLLISFSIYVFLGHVSVRIAHENGVYSKTQFYIMRAMAIIDVLLITYTIEIFGVHPKDNMFMHTLPFSALVVAIMGMGLRNCYVDFHMVDWSSTYSFLKYVELGAALLMAIFSVGKLYIQYSAIVLRDPIDAQLGGLNDKGWLFFGVALPWLKSLVTICAPKLLPRKDQYLHITVGTTSIIDCGCCQLKNTKDAANQA